jgi:hypothetical protein
MEVEIVLKNYRCFPDTNPARFVLRGGFTSFVGVNNSGKSSLLKFFYEFRDLFQKLLDANTLKEVLRGTRLSFELARSIFDPEELFCNTNNRGLEIQFMPTNGDSQRSSLPIPQRLVLTVPRAQNVCFAELYTPDSSADLKEHLSITGGPGNATLVHSGTPIADLSCLFDTFEDLANTLYIGPFRNAINVGTKEDYPNPRVRS